MQKYFRFPSFVCLMAVVTVFISCQQEEPFQEAIDPERTLSADAQVIEMMKRVSANDGSYDNIVDGASCVGIQFPYTVTVNGTELTIGSIQDLEKIEKIFDADDEGEHTTKITFPIDITLADQLDVTVNSEEELDGYSEQCVEKGDDFDIECIDVVYPVGFFTYDTNLQQTGAIVTNHDKELQRFLAGIKDAELIGVDFPIRFLRYDSTEITVNDNAQLADILASAVNACDEDDDNDYNDDDFTKESLERRLVTCPWSVRKIQKVGLAAPEPYLSYLLTFMEDGTVTSDNGFSPVSDGKWSVDISDYKVFLTMEFADGSDFNGSLYTYEIGGGMLKMDGGVNNRILLEQSCGYQDQSCGQVFIEETLQTECRWSITDGHGEFIEDLNIDFSAKNLLAYNADGTAIDEGSWAVSETTITFSDMKESLAHYVGDWAVIACSEERFRLQRGDETLVLVKQCDKES